MPALPYCGDARESRYFTTTFIEPGYPTLGPWQEERGACLVEHFVDFAV